MNGNNFAFGKSNNDDTNDQFWDKLEKDWARNEDSNELMLDSTTTVSRVAWILTAAVAIAFFHWWHAHRRRPTAATATTSSSSSNHNNKNGVASSEEERRLRRDRLALAAAARHTAPTIMNPSSSIRGETATTSTSSSPSKALKSSTKKENYTTAATKPAPTIKTSSVPKNTNKSVKTPSDDQQQQTQPAPSDHRMDAAAAAPAATPSTIDEAEISNGGNTTTSAATTANNNVPPVEPPTTSNGDHDDIMEGSHNVRESDTPSHSTSVISTTTIANEETLATSTPVKNHSVVLSNDVLPISNPHPNELSSPSSPLPSSSSTPNSGSKKKKLAAVPPPPVQVLCHALSWIVQQEVQVVPTNEDVGTWGGVGWKPSLPLSSLSSVKTSPTTTMSNSGTVYQLAFYRWYHLCNDDNENHVEENSDSATLQRNDNEWRAVLEAFEKLLQDPELVQVSSSNGWKLRHLRQALQWHQQAELLLRHQGSPLIQWWTVSTGSKNRSNTLSNHPWPYVASAIQTFQTWLLQQVVAMWFGPPDELALDNAYTDVDEDDLFQDDYDSSSLALVSPTTTQPAILVSSAHVATTAPTNSRDAIHQILTLLEHDDVDKILVTSSFLDGLIACYHRYYQERLEPVAKQATGTTTNSLFLADIFLRHCLLGLQALMVHDKETAPSSIVIRRRLSACTQLCTRSVHIVQALVQRFEKEAITMRSSTSGKSGREVERTMLIQPICFLAAFTVPDVATLDANGSLTGGGSTKHVNWLLTQLQTLENFPLCAFSNKNAQESNALHQKLEECQVTIRLARQTATTILSKALSKNKHHVLQWLAAVVSTNEALTALLSWELLAPDGVAAVSATPAFLLGLTSTLVNFCSGSLLERFEKEGVGAFDCNYLVKGRPELRSDEKSLMPPPSSGRQDSKTASAAAKPEPTIKFSGATEFFFLASSLLRVSLYPVLRVEEAFHQKHSKLMTLLGAPSPQLPLHIIQASISVTTAWLGWSCFLNEPDFVATITDFALLQLRWLVATARSNAKALESIPEWMCKEPAWWLAHVARHTASNLKPVQANAAVDCATELVQFGSNPTKGRAALSPVVLIELIRIAAAFVQAGVSRAKRRQKLRKSRRHHDESDSDLSDDEHNMDAYLSFDQNDLGVSVFTNRLVCTQLCPALLTAFCSLDIVEGLDVDKEHAFDKFSAKVEIGELLLRLWSHPNGECRTSIIRLPENAFATFASSLAAAVGFLLDDAIHRFADVCQNKKAVSPSAQDQQFAERQATSAVGACVGGRRLLLLMCHLSHDDQLSAFMGGGRGGTSSVCTDLANMVIHFIVNLLTTPEGGTKSDLEITRTKETTQSMLFRYSEMATSEKATLVTEILKSRHFCMREVGLDVALICTTFLALAARWHRASKGDSSTSPLLNALAANDDCDTVHLRKVFDRMVKQPGPMIGNDVDNAYAIFEHDGYVDTTAWLEKYHVKAATQIHKDRWRRAKQYKITRQHIESVATDNDIRHFLDALDDVLRSKSNGPAAITAANVEGAQRQILTAKASMVEEGYGKSLSDWIVSSDSFASPNDPSSFMHYYGKTALSRGNTNAGKQLVHEARRCHKGLPTPHSNSASFVCFDESRMDLCRAIVTGPCETPYAHGIFVFDVYFPPMFPQIPPLVTFMTTGGGTTRFGPNLYQDGKVCLSLLGTFHALDESERWHPGVSSLAQILLSIQTQLLTAEPYFNEPGVEIMQGTPAGEDNSRRYNSNLRLATLRHGIIGCLREPPKGFEEISLRHFSMCRKRIVVQALRWMVEAEGTPLYPKFKKAYAELLSLLSQEMFQQLGSLPPVPEDVQAVRDHDPSLLTELLLKGDEDDEDRKPSAKLPARNHDSRPTESNPPSTEASNIPSVASLHPATGYNPWAGLGMDLLIDDSDRPFETYEDDDEESDDDSMYD